MAFLDAHCHLSDPRLPRTEALEAARALGVRGWVLGGFDPSDWDRQLAVKRELGSAVVTSFGLHPWWVAGKGEAQIADALAKLEARLPEAGALGETGLDFTRARESQRRAFDAQIELVGRLPKPLVLHVVRAHGPALESLRGRAPFSKGGLVHGFSASLPVARAYLDLGFVLSVGTGLLREGFHALKKTLHYVPSERLVIETDAPDGGPLEALPAVAQAVATLRGSSAEEVLAQSNATLTRMFGIHP